MPKKKEQEENTLVFRFGGGLHTRASEDQINPLEAADGKNFNLDPIDHSFQNRKPFDLAGTAPNASQINGFVSLLKSDGSVSFLVQAGTTVYEWDGLTSFVSKGTVTSGAKIRGRLEHQWQLTDKVLITDLGFVHPVMEWDGTTLQNVSFTNEAAGAFGTFRARYCTVQNERAIFANVHSNGTDSEHLIVGSKRGDYTQITVSNRPSSSLSNLDPFFVVQLDNRYINGLIEAFGTTITSSLNGDMFKMTGTNAQNFQIEPLYPRSGASGNESVTYVGNDIVYGKVGAIESVASTDQFGDVETNDLSASIYDKVKTYKDWTIVYNSRTQRVYCFPDDVSECWVLHKPMIGQPVSPWSKWTTTHPMAFQPTAVMNAYDPQDKLEYVFMGDTFGNIYRLEGTGSGDGGTYDITCERLTGMVRIPSDASMYNIDGWIIYRKNVAATVTLRFEYAGISVFNETITISIPADTSGIYWGGFYWGGGYWGSKFAGRLTRQRFGVPGRSTEFQVRITVEGSTDFEIQEIGFRFYTAA